MSMGSDHSKVVKKVLKKNIFVFLGNPLNRDKIFEIFFYQWIAFIHTKTLIPHWSSLDMCVRHSSASKSKSVKIGIWRNLLQRVNEACDRLRMLIPRCWCVQSVTWFIQVMVTHAISSIQKINIWPGSNFVRWDWKGHF